MAMDFISGPTAVTTVRTPDSDTDTPPHVSPAKRVHHEHVSYKECMKNHAASRGGHAVDGCCEFLPGPTANPLDPTSLTCAACGCHRNFHRRDPDDPTPLHHLIPPRRPHSPPSASQLLLSLSGGHTHSPSAPSDPEMMNIHTHTPTPTTAAAAASTGGAMVGFYSSNGGAGGGQNGNFQSRKRFRTKFSQEQKEKMHEFSEKIGWRLKKGEEVLVNDFCKHVGVDRSVFKVWMHNNKHSSSASGSASALGSASDKIGNGNHDTNSSNNNNNNNNSNSISNNVGLNCGGVVGSALDFNFANGGGQEAKAQ